MAKRLFDVPIALVSLVDADRQWFKSCCGLLASETPRSISFCGHAILGDEVFIIPNALEDHRFADNPLVVSDPNIRFYAGCPLRLADDIKVGTLCVIDDKARGFNAEDESLLQDLANMVIEELNTLKISTIDELTNISNRRGFLQLGNTALRFCTEHAIATCLVFIDLDKFKPINDTYGHAEGDRVLVEFAAAMKNAFRGSDLIGRLGGDEFVALVISTDRENAERFMHKVADRIQTNCQMTNRPYSVRFSYGIVELDPKKHAGLDEILAEGDALMYAQKAAR